MLICACKSLCRYGKEEVQGELLPGMHTYVKGVKIINQQGKYNEACCPTVKAVRMRLHY